MVANDWLAQDLADMLALPVERPRFAETTALGAAMLAGVGAGLLGQVVSPRQAVLYLLGAALGLVLYHAAFGFTSAWRVFIADRRGPAQPEVEIALQGVGHLNADDVIL